jgi:hypothetical protein
VDRGINDDASYRTCCNTTGNLHYKGKAIGDAAGLEVDDT